MVPPNNLGPDLNGKFVNETQFRGMIGSLMYLTASRPDIQFSTCLSARYQANPKESHLIAVKRIFRYLKGTPCLGLWYPNCSGFDLKGYSESNYAGCNMDMKSTSVKPWFAKIGYNREIGVKGTLKKSCLPPRWRLLMGQIIQCLGDVPNVPKALKPSSNAERVPQGTKPRAKTGYKKHSTSSTQQPLQTSSSTLMVAEMHKEDQQAAGGPISLEVTSKEGAHPQLSSSMSAFTYIEPIYSASYIFHSESASGNDALADFTAEADPEISAEMGHKLPTLYQLEQDKQKAAAEITTLKAHSSIPTKLKELPTKLTALSREVNELKKHIKEFEIELPEVAELKKHKWELPKEILNLTGQISLVQSYIQTLEALSGLLNKVTDTLNRFGSILNAHNKGVPLVGKSSASPTEGEKNTNPGTEDAELEKLVDLIGIDVVEEYHKKKLLYNRYYNKMLKRKKNPKITNCEVLIKKELKIDLNKPLKEQDLLNELNELGNKKRKRASDFSDEPRSAKKDKSSVQQ
ncbi:hypothetical protein Tco_0784427 [Tanacetum coccineum]